MSINLADVQARVLELELFNSVQNTLSAADAMENFNSAPPAGFVSTASERASSNTLSTGRMRQRVMQTVSVLFVLGTGRADEAEGDEMEAARKAIMEHLVGWRADGAEAAFEYVSYSLVQIADGLAWGEVLVQAPWYLIK